MTRAAIGEVAALMHMAACDQPHIVRAAQLHDSDGALGAIAAIFHQSPLLAGYPDPASSAEPVHQRRSAL